MGMGEQHIIERPVLQNIFDIGDHAPGAAGKPRIDQRGLLFRYQQKASPPGVPPTFVMVYILSSFGVWIFVLYCTVKTAPRARPLLYLSQKCCIFSLI